MGTFTNTLHTAACLAVASEVEYVGGDDNDTSYTSQALLGVVNRKMSWDIM